MKGNANKADVFEVTLVFV